MNLSKQLTLIKKLSQAYRSGISPVKIFRDYHGIQKAIQDGQPLSEALKKEEDLLDDVYIRLIYIGEKSGRLEQTLAHIAELMDGILKIKRELNKLRYPIIQIIVAFITGLIVFFVVIPSLDSFMQKMDSGTPLMITIFLNIKKMIPFIIYVGLGFLAYRIYTQEYFEIPIISPLRKLKDFYTYFYTMKICYESGLSVLESMELASSMVSNEYLNEEFLTIYEKAKDQLALTSLYQESKLFDDEIIDVIESGEETGNLEQSYSEILRIIEERIMTIIEKIMLYTKPMPLLLGALVLMFIFSVITDTFLNSFSKVSETLFK